MKATKKTVAAKKLSKINVSKSSIAYKVVAELIGLTAEKSYMISSEGIRPVYTSGSGRYISNQDHTGAILSLLKQIGIDTVLSNDSPRGGLKGNLLTITTKLI